MTVQSVVINKIQAGKQITLKVAKKQLQSLGYDSPYGVDETSNTYRFRQFDPLLFKENTFSTKPIIMNKKNIGFFVVAKIKLYNNIIYNASRATRK